MENPWLNLRTDTDDFVLDGDRPCLDQHNLSANDQTKFVAGSIPEPFIGSPDTATVVFLGKNPGHADGAEREYRERPDLCNAMFSNLRHKLNDYPFYPLNPVFANTGAGRWWRTRTLELQKGLKWDFKKLAERMMVIEWFPYHSIKFKRPAIELLSQAYSFCLLQGMLDKNVLVVGMRAKSLWTKVDPRIASIPFLRNPQCGHISTGNTDGNLFERIVATLKG